MDFVLILLAIGGAVVSAVMLLLASRATRQERDSDARVQELQVLATGSVLFASDAFDEFTPAAAAPGAIDDVMLAPLASNAVAQYAARPLEAGGATEYASAPLAIDPFDEFNDECHDEGADHRLDAPAAAEPAPPEPSRRFEAPSRPFPFVLTVQAGGGRFAGSFDRAQDGSRT